MEMPLDCSLKSCSFVVDFLVVMVILKQYALLQSILRAVELIPPALEP